MKSIRIKITFGIVFCSLISALLISFTSISNSSELSNADAEKELSLTCKNAGSEINALISRIEQSVDTLSSIAMERMEFSKFKNDSRYVSQYTKDLMDDFLIFAENTDGAICAYIRYNPEFTEPTSGIFLTRSDTESPFESVTPTDFSIYDKDDLAHVGWYYIPVENKAPLWMDPYLNENINIYMISYVVPLYIDGTSVGIIGMDIDFSQITDFADTITAFETGYSFIADSQGNILHHKEIPAGVDTATYNNGELASVKTLLSDANNEGVVEKYRYNGMNKYLSFCILDNGMRLVLNAPLTEIKANANNLSLKILGFLVLGVVVSGALGAVIGTSISAPIKKMTAIIKQTSQLNFKKSAHGSALVRRKDETGTMAGAISEMRKVLRDLVGGMEQVKDNLLNNMSLLDDVMKENNAASEDNSATTQELAAGMEETTANTTLIVNNIGAIQNNVKDIQMLSERGQQESANIVERAKELRDNTSASSSKTMEICESMREEADNAIELSQVVA